MTHWGKLVGGVAGLFSGRWWLVALGLLLGHQFDRGFADRLGRFGPDVSARRLTEVSAAFVDVLFKAMGHLSKADGRVSEDEIRAARALMHRLGLDPVQIREAINSFETGKQQDFPLHEKVQTLDRKLPSDHRALFVRLLTEFAISKGSLHERERHVIWQVCSALSISRVELAQLEAMLRAQQGFRRSAAGNADARKVEAAYRTLGVDPDASNDDIKKSYRRLMNRIHPDKLSGAEPDDAMISEAERRTREVRRAYELLKARRSIR